MKASGKDVTQTMFLGIKENDMLLNIPLSYSILDLSQLNTLVLFLFGVIFSFTQILMNVAQEEAHAGGILSVSTLWEASSVNVYLVINYRGMVGDA